MLKDKHPPRLLHIVPYDTFVPAKNGGALRCYHLCVELSKYYSVTLLTYQNSEQITDPLFDSIEVFNPHENILEKKGLMNKLRKAFLYRWYQRSLKGPAEAAVLAFYPLIKRLAKTQEYDVVVMEHLSSMTLGNLIKRQFPRALRLVDQHNVDHLLFAQNHDLQNLKHRKVYNRLKNHESRIFKYTDYFMACSQEDVNTLEKINKYKVKGIVVPNGTKKRDIVLKDQEFHKPELLFCGSLDYQPNKNGLIWFFKEVWPFLKTQLPDVRLTIIGRHGENPVYNPLKRDRHIDFIGEVEDVAPYYLKSTLAIVPLLEGSGTRLKILEAMSFGVPVISTSIGAEGIDYKKDENIVIADSTEDYEQAIVSLFINNSKLYNIAKNGQSLVIKKYEWGEIVHEFTRVIEKLVSYKFENK